MVFKCSQLGKLDLFLQAAKIETNLLDISH